ncbi:hypothetical protein L6164_009360 [Bauhinia variegata]|uniref:Uncharacterized protein n=1 Tax=Bauhinia variegata TaxID=167791 RepID=A0ACB9PKT5_BAUVA|nr:hypothetical protein L6164_009360 [Bauhinia variegata]
MTGGSVGGDLLAPEDVVSLLLDDAQLEQKLKEVPLQGKDKQKRKQPTKGIRINEEGDASLEDITNTESQGACTDNDLSLDPGGSKSSGKKRKAASDKQTPSRVRNSGKGKEVSTMRKDHGLDDTHLYTHSLGQKPKGTRRLKKSVNEKFEESFDATSTIVPELTEYPRQDI